MKLLHTKETMGIKINHILSAVCIVLVLLIAASIWQPVHFDSERKKREAAVTERLKEIRRAESIYLKRHGRFAASARQLADEKLIEKGHELVPFSEGKSFEIAVTMFTGKSGRPSPVMECGATFSDYLSGLDENKIKELTEEANLRGEYPGLKFGDITTPNNNAGNWE